MSRNTSRLREPVFFSPLNLVSSCFISTTCGTRGRRFETSSGYLTFVTVLLSRFHDTCHRSPLQVSGGEARRLLPPGSRLKFYDQSFTGEEFKRVSSEGVFHQVFAFKILCTYMHFYLNQPGNRVLVWAETCTLAQDDVSVGGRLQVP